MAQIPFRVNLSASKIPLISQFEGRTVIVQQQDQNYIPAVVPNSSNDPAEDKDRGIPQAYYAHNVMPSAQGFQSIGYVQRAANAPVPVTFAKRWIVQNAGGNFVYMAIDSVTNQTYILDASLIWQPTVNKPGAGYVGGMITSAYVNGVTYINFQGDDCYTYNFGALTLVSAAIVGIVIANMIGISGAAGYLLAWDITALYWSSTISAIDFVPSLATGAGSGAVQNAKGPLAIVAPITTGVIVYTGENAVAGVYSGNSRFPFNFREITSTGGCTNLDLLSYDANTGNHYIYSTSGLQLVSSISSTTVFPDITDFISGKLFEDFDEPSMAFIIVPLVALMQKKLTVVSDRYLVISYGVNSLTHAIVVDLVNKRIGKVKIAHTECFEYQILGANTTEVPRESIAFLTSAGRIVTVDFSVFSAGSSGVLLLGKYQYIRQRMLQLQSAAVEQIQQGAAFKIYDIPTYDGKTFQAMIQGTLNVANSPGLQKEYNFNSVGKNHSLLLIGDFYLSSMTLNFNEHGRR